MAIKVKIKQPGAHIVVKGETQELKVGTVLDFEGDEIPGFLVGKAEKVGDNEGKELATNDELLAEADKQIAELTAENGKLKSDLDQADRDLEKAKAVNSDLTAEIEKLKSKK
jgi:chromosome segregation ATPase